MAATRIKALVLIAALVAAVALTAGSALAAPAKASAPAPQAPAPTVKPGDEVTLTGLVDESEMGVILQDEMGLVILEGGDFSGLVGKRITVTGRVAQREDGLMVMNVAKHKLADNQ